MTDHSTTYELERDDATFDLEIDYSMSRFYPARTYGLPEDCYPAEGGEIENIDVRCDGSAFELTAKEKAKIETWLYENHEHGE